MKRETKEKKENVRFASLESIPSHLRSCYASVYIRILMFYVFFNMSAMFANETALKLYKLPLIYVCFDFNGVTPIKTCNSLPCVS